MQNYKLTKNGKKRFLIFVVAMIIGAMLLLLSSCSVSSHVTCPNKKDLKIVWCDYDHIITIDYRNKIKKIRNIDHETYFVGDYMICKEEFRNKN